MPRNSIALLLALALAGSLAAQTPAHGTAPGMKVTELAKTGRTFEVTMRRGDEVIAGLTEFARQNHVKVAHFTAVGAIDSGVLGWFDPDKRAYKRIEINQEAEVVSLAGNIAIQNGSPYVHAHCVVALSDGSTRGGHLLEGHVSLAMQIFVVDSGATEASSVAIPVPKVTGPLATSADSYPFGAAGHTLVPSDLAKDGYVEEEFLVSGTANIYDWPAPGPAVVRTSNAPYTTRVLVRRPANRAKFQREHCGRDAEPVQSVRLESGLGHLAQAVRPRLATPGWVSPPSRCRW